MKQIPLGKKFIGTVVDNNDPEQWARVKVMIEGLFDGYKTEDLPWLSVLQPVGRGSNGNVGKLYIPRVNSRVYCEFDDGDPDSGFVTHEMVDRNSKRTALHQNYPKSYGFIDENGTMHRVNTQTKVMTIVHEGTTIVLSPGGVVTINTTHVTLTAPTTDIIGDVNIQGDVSITGNTTQTGSMGITGITTINGHTEVVGNLRNNGKDVGSTHVHSGVQTGPSNSGMPI